MMYTLFVQWDNR
ncbi:Protein of unknown function [Bacillus mycoides]|nr:Protein of unknown function [Bacillus mycoides]